MGRATRVVVSGGIAALCFVAGAVAQTAGDLVGTWRNVSNQTIQADGKRTDNFGPKGVGMLIFTADGRFMVINVNPDTPKFASNSRAQGTPEENKAAVMGSIGLFGTYSVANKVVSMNVEGSTYPNWTGTVQTRNIAALTSEELKWTLTGSSGGAAELVFKRIK